MVGMPYEKENQKRVRFLSLKLEIYEGGKCIHQCWGLQLEQVPGQISRMGTTGAKVVV